MRHFYFISFFLIPTFCYGGDLKLIDPLTLEPVQAWKGVAEPLPKRGNYFLPTGFTFDAVLETAIFSYNLITPALSFMDRHILFGKEVVIPKGSKLVGNVRVLHSLDRVHIDFHTLVFPNGQEIKVNFLALSPDGSAGIKGKVEKHKDIVAAKVAMRSVLAAAQTGANISSSVEGTMAAGLAQEASASLDTTNLKQIESISVEERTPIKLFNKSRLEF